MDCTVVFDYGTKKEVYIFDGNVTHLTQSVLGYIYSQREFTGRRAKVFREDVARALEGGNGKMFIGLKEVPTGYFIW